MNFIVYFKYVCLFRGILHLRNAPFSAKVLIVMHKSNSYVPKIAHMWGGLCRWFYLHLLFSCCGDLIMR